MITPAPAMLSYILQRLICTVRERDGTPFCYRCPDCKRCRYHGAPCRNGETGEPLPT